jgi:hypothetical protein
MPYRTASYDKSNVGTSAAGLKSDNVRKPPTDGPSRVTRAAAGVVLAAMACGLSHREAVDLVAVTALAGISCAVNPEMADTVKARLYTATAGYVLAKRARRAA